MYLSGDVVMLIKIQQNNKTILLISNCLHAPLLVAILHRQNDKSQEKNITRGVVFRHVKPKFAAVGPAGVPSSPTTKKVGAISQPSISCVISAEAGSLTINLQTRWPDILPIQHRGVDTRGSTLLWHDWKPLSSQYFVIAHKIANGWCWKISVVHVRRSRPTHPHTNGRCISPRNSAHRWG